MKGLVYVKLFRRGQKKIIGQKSIWSDFHLELSHSFKKPNETLAEKIVKLQTETGENKINHTETGENKIKS